MKERTSSQGVKRRLNWSELGGSQDSGSLKESDEAPGSPCDAPAAALAGPQHKDVLQDPSSTAVPAGVDSGRGVVQSPIIDGALFLDGRRKARIVRQAQQQQHHDDQHVSPGQPQSNSQQHDQGADDAAVMQCRAVLAAAGSSSRGCLDLLCWGAALDHHQQQQQQQQQEAWQASPATPAAASAGLMPAPPRKCTAVYRPLRAAGTQSCRAARVLPGLGPSSEADLQQMRTWLAAQKAN